MKNRPFESSCWELWQTKRPEDYYTAPADSHLRHQVSLQQASAEAWVQQPRMEVLRRSSVFAAEVMEVFDRSPTDKELVSQAKALCRDYINSRLIRAGVSWSKPEYNAPVPGGKLAEVSTILLRLGKPLRVWVGTETCMERSWPD